MLAEEQPESMVEEFAPGDIGGKYRTYLASTPGEVLSELPLTAAAARSVGAGRLLARRVLSGADERLLVVVGPCSIHDVNAGLAYAKSLGELAGDLADDLAVVMRVSRSGRH
ncbi:hypothetical protein [Streptomyces lasiicapitis]|uniref:hypothetical protein n=1 Tax=Streptomyces lasiicapitis TaxID=1923961 RepID=UPI00364C2DF5